MLRGLVGERLAQTWQQQHWALSERANVLSPPRVSHSSRVEVEGFSGPTPADQLLADFVSTATDATGEHVAALTANAVYVSDNFGQSYNRSTGIVGQNFVDIAMAASAPEYVIVSGYGYLSTSSDFGSTFTPVTVPAAYWHAVAVSANGTYAYAISTSSYNVYGSINNGLTSFVPLTSSAIVGYEDVATSASGEIVYAINTNSFYSSTNYGSSWTQHTVHVGGSVVAGYNVAISADGQYVAISGVMSVFTSNNYGKSFYVASGTNGYRAVDLSMSSSGALINVVISAEPVLASTNYGKSFHELASGSQPFSSVSTSADGNAIFASCHQGYVFHSVDAGSTWSPLYYDWIGVASSADGTRRFAVSGYTFSSMAYMSTDSGETWQAITNLPAYEWTSVSCDSTCQHVSITSLYYGAVYVSNDYGSSWSKVTISIGTYGAVQDSAWSSDGQYVAACVNNGYVSTSNNAGQTFVQQLNSSISNCWSIASSANGQQLIVAAGNYVYFNAHTTSGQLLLSRDYGVTWHSQFGSKAYAFSCVASSSSGAVLLAVAGYGGPVLVSSDSGASWTTANATGQNWQACASNAAGDVLVVASGGGPGSTVSKGQISVSLDSGLTWTLTDSPTVEWYGLASDSTGQYLTANAFDGQIYTSADFGTTWVAQNITITVAPYSDDDDTGDSSNNDSLSGGAIAGIVVGGIALLAIIGVAVAVLAFGVALPCFRKTPMADLSEPLAK